MGKLLARIIVIALTVIIAAIVGLFAVSHYVVDSTKDNVRTIAQIEEQGVRADCIVVLGASVYADGTPSDILSDRLEVAVDLYQAGAAPAIVVSGDNHDSHYNESDAMKAYCVSLGVPASAILVDRAGYDTYDSIWRAHFVYGAQSAIVVTQAYHLYRALSIAEGLGMSVWGVAADKGEYDNQTLYSVRENAARVKDLVQTFLRMQPEDADQPIQN